MIFTETKLEGAYVVDMEPITDERGFFSRTWCKKEFGKKGLNPNLVQCNLSHNKKRGTVRGMHFQIAPCAEAKLVRCIKGSIYDVIIDLRPDSETFKKWFAVTLSEQNKKMLYVPEGFAHGFQTLEENTDVFYQVSEYYHPQYERGVRFNDDAFQIEWPDVDHMIISEKDRRYEDFVS